MAVQLVLDPVTVTVLLFVVGWMVKMNERVTRIEYMLKTHIAYAKVRRSGGEEEKEKE